MRNGSLSQRNTLVLSLQGVITFTFFSSNPFHQRGPQLPWLPDPKESLCLEDLISTGLTRRYIDKWPFICISLITCLRRLQLYTSWAFLDITDLWPILTKSRLLQRCCVWGFVVAARWCGDCRAQRHGWVPPVFHQLDSGPWLSDGDWVGRVYSLGSLHC